MNAGDANHKFRPEIEGLRAVAVVLVLLYHAQFDVMSGGFIGVDVFFVLSGFLITSVLLRELATTGSVSLAGFWARRARRLLPASALVVLATLVGGRLLLDGLSQRDLASDAIASSAFTANFRFLSVGTDYLAEGRDASPLLHFWSLAVEEQFYLVWPGLLLLLVRYARMGKRLLIAVLSAIAVVSLLFCVRTTHGQQMWAFFMLPTRAWELLAGAILAVLGGSLWRNRDWLRAFLGYGGLLTIVGVAAIYSDATLFPGSAAIIPVVATVAVINAGGSVRGPARLLRLAPMQWVGARSYAIYLWHFPMLMLAQSRYGPLTSLARTLLLIGSVAVAALSYKLLENPVRFSPRLVGNPRASLLMGAGAVSIGVIAASVLIHNPPRLATDTVAAAPALITVVPATTVEAVKAVAAAATTTSTTPAPPTTMLRPFVADASHDNPPELEPLLRANLSVLNAAVAINEVPSNLEPNLADSKSDLPVLYADKCILNVGVREPKECIYGDPAGSISIVLFGDSHAAQWMPGINKVAIANGWRLIVHAKKACPSAEILTAKDPNRNDCAKWRAQVVADMETLRPDLIVMSGYQYKPVKGNAGRSPNEIWWEGTELTVAKLKPFAGNILILGDSATPAGVIPYCLAKRVTKVATCMASRENAVLPERLAGEREIAARYDIDFIPTSDWMCTDTACPVIVGNVLMYRDDSHITATASLLLAPYIELALLHALT